MKKKNLLAKLGLAVLLCSSIVPAVAGTHYKTIKLGRENATFTKGQSLSFTRQKLKDRLDVAILAETLVNTSKIDMSVKDSQKHDVLGWKAIKQYGYWQEWSIHPVEGNPIDKGSLITVLLKDHYEHKNLTYVDKGEIDTY